jgi:hypothetical protein
VLQQDIAFGRDNDAMDDELRNDGRVQYEFQRLNQYLDDITDFPLDESPATSDASWTIPENDVSRWVITLKGEMRSDRVSAFRTSLLGCDNVVDARVDDLSDGRIRIRLLTTGGIQMGPVQQAVRVLRDSSEPSGQLTFEAMSQLASA